MSVRTSTKTVAFAHPFKLDGMERSHPAGSFLVQTDEELIDSVSFIAYRRVATVLHLTTAGRTELVTVDPSDLDAALAEDRGADIPTPRA